MYIHFYVYGTHVSSYNTHDISIDISGPSLRMGLQGQPCSTCHTQECYTCGSLSPSGELQGLDCKTELDFLCY